MPYCPYCGKEIGEGSRFCPHCGNSITQSGRPAWSFPASNIIPKEEDYIAFIGNNAEKYLKKFNAFTVGGIENFALTWHWPAFLFGFWWMLYRKLYAWALLAFLVACIPYVGFAGMIAWGITGNYIYYRHATSKIMALRQMQPSANISVALAQIGGVNRWVIWVAVVLIIIGIMVVLLFSIFSAIFATKGAVYYM
jgi:hypothetical protein